MIRDPYTKPFVGLVFLTSAFALPFALGVFPQRLVMSSDRLEESFHGRGGENGQVVFNRGI